VVDQGKTFPGYGFVGHMSPVGDRIVAGDVVSVSRATSSRSSVEDVTRMGPIVCAPVISWLLHGEDTKNDEGLDPSKIPATDGVHALLRGIARSKKGNPVVDAMKGISETIDRIVRGTR